MKNNKRLYFFLYASMLLAAYLGSRAQDLAYWLHKAWQLPLMVGLGTATFLSLGLFLFPPLLTLGKRGQARTAGQNIYLALNILLGLCISAFSILVFIAWLG